MLCILKDVFNVRYYTFKLKTATNQETNQLANLVIWNKVKQRKEMVNWRWGFGKKKETGELTSLYFLTEVFALRALCLYFEISLFLVSHSCIEKAETDNVTFRNELSEKEQVNKPSWFQVLLGDYVCVSNYLGNLRLCWQHKFWAHLVTLY